MVGSSTNGHPHTWDDVSMEPARWDTLWLNIITKEKLSLEHSRIKRKTSTHFSFNAASVQQVNKKYDNMCLLQWESSR